MEEYILSRNKDCSSSSSSSSSFIVPVIEKGTEDQSGERSGLNKGKLNMNERDGYGSFSFALNKENGEEFVKGLMKCLPMEVKVKITDNLNQHDLVKLASVSSIFYDAAMRSLYDTVVIDSSYSVLNDMFGKNSIEKKHTYIKSKFNLNKFMKSLWSAKMETRCPAKYLVKNLKIVRLPDGVSNLEISAFVHRSIGSLINLSCFYWESDSHKLPENTLEYLPNKMNLLSLAINLDLSTYVGNSISLPKLEKLSIAPFVNSKNLITFMTQILKGSNASNLKVLQLKRQLPLMCQLSTDIHQSQSLIVTKFMVDNQLKTPNSDEKDEFLNYNQLDLEFWKFLNPFTNNTVQTFPSLIVLALDGISFLSTDSNRLIQYINLSQLETLSFNNSTEIQWLNNVNFLVTDFTNLVQQNFHPSFLLSIAPYLQLLKRLKLDYQEPCRDTIPHFIAKLAKSGVMLQEIDITIHWSKQKLATIKDWKTLAFDYAKSICMHRKSLSKLSLDPEEHLPYSKRSIPIPHNALLKLTDCIGIKSLRINADSLQPTGSYLLKKFPCLTYLSIHGRKVRGPMYLSLQAMQDTITDDWYSLTNVATTLSQINENIKFIMIDKCLFYRDHLNSVVPCPDTLNAWFVKNTRVVVSDESF